MRDIDRNAGATANGPFTTSATSILRLLPTTRRGSPTSRRRAASPTTARSKLSSVNAGYSSTVDCERYEHAHERGGGTITTLVGAGGLRTFDVQLNNLGTVTLNQPLTLSHTSAAHTNSGTIDASAADFALTQSGTNPSFTNTGTVTIGAGHFWTINGGTLNQNAGSIGGAGTLSLSNMTASFATTSATRRRRW